ncbi:UNVERIFIED_CONTAM: hypothetical protein H355_013775, partial [Colinus virginianus]
ELNHSQQAEASHLEPALPPRPVDGKIIPARPPPPKGVPGRPPPPKLSATKTSSQKDALSRSTSDIASDKKTSKLRLGPKRSKSQVLKNQDPALPPRPKPGHPLYNKYMLSVPHGVAKENCLPRNHGELSRKIDLPEEGKRKKTPCSSQSIKGPRCVARFEYIGDQRDELSFSEGETIILKEYINEEWAKGELRGMSGIFPLNFVEVIEDLPGKVAVLCEGKIRMGKSGALALTSIPETKDDLSFRKGDYIQILEQVDSEWYRGRLNEKEGIFPAVFVQTRSGQAAHKGRSEKYEVFLLVTNSTYTGLDF